MKNKINLNWTPLGYQPEGYEWWNYTQLTNVYSLRHDLYHHQQGESGTGWEELRAFGARFRFEDKISIEVILQHFKPLLSFRCVPEKYNINLNLESKISALYGKIVFLPEFIQFQHLDYFFSVLNDGYLNAHNFTLKAYKEFLNINFKELHNLGKNLTVDLNTGKLCKKN